jgi:hypothetical protein
VGKSGFTYERLGVRVPTLLVSPYIAPGTVFRAPPSSPYDFDHTSFIKTILQWAGTGDDFMALMGERVRQAPTFDAVLSDTPVAGAPTFVVPSHYGAESAMKGLRLPFDTADLTDDVVMALAETVSSREELLQKLLGRSGPTPG